MNTLYQKFLLLLRNHFLFFLFSFAIIVLLFLFVFIFSLFQPQNQPSPSLTSNVPENVTVNPLPNSTNVSLFTEITVTFSQPLSQSAQKQLSLSLSPKVQGKTSWDNNTVLRFIPSSSYQTSTTYTVTIKTTDEPITWSFRTVSVENTSFDDQVKLQTQSDFEYGQKMQEMSEKYPWKDDFPLQSDEYFVYFNVEREVTVAKLYPKTNSVEQLKRIIEPQLRAIDPRILSYQIDWQEN